MGFLANLLVKIGVDTRDLSAGMDKATRSVNTFAREAESAGQRLSVGVTLPLVGLGLAAVKTAGQMEQTQTAFTTLLKSSDAAKAHLEELKRFALVTPFQFEDLTKASRLMQAYGFAAADVVPKLRTIGNAVSALGGGSELLERVVRSMGEIGTRGKITGEQLRELSRAGIPALDAIAKKLGVSVAEAQKQITAGTVDAKIAMDALLEYMQTRFAGGMEAQAKTVLGSWSNIKDKITFTLADIGQALLPVAKNVMNTVLDPMLTKVQELASAFSKLPSPVQNATLAFSGLAAAMPLLTIGLGATITNAIAVGNAFSKIWTVTASLRGVLTGPIGWITAIGVAAYEAGDYLQKRFGSGMDTATEALKKFNGEASKAATHLSPKNLPSQASAIMNAALDATAKEAGKVIDIEKMLTDAGMKTMAQRKRDLEEAKTLYAAVAKEYGAGSEIALEAMERVKQATAALVPTLKEVKQGVQGLFKFGERGVESAVLIEQLRQADAELKKWIQDVVKAGGLQKYQAQTTLEVENAMRLLADSVSNPLFKEDSKVRDLLEGITNAAIPVQDDLKRVADALDYFGLAGKRTDIDQMERQFNALGAGLEAGAVSVEQYTRAWIALVKAMDAAGVALPKETIKQVIALEKQYGGQINATRKEETEFEREITRAFHSISRGIASSIVNWKGWGETFKTIAKDTAQSILTIFVEGMFKKLAKQFADLLANAKGVLGKIGGWLGGIAGGGSSAASSAGGAASSAGGAASSAAGAATSGLMGTIGAVGAAVGAVSSVIGNFQMAGMNKSLDVLVNHTLRIFNVVYQMLDEHYLFKGQLFAKMDDLWRTNLNIYDQLGKMSGVGGGGKGGITFNNCNFTGSPNEIASAIFTQAQLAGAI